MAMQIENLMKVIETQNGRIKELEIHNDELLSSNRTLVGIANLNANECSRLKKVIKHYRKESDSLISKVIDLKVEVQDHRDRAEKELASSQQHGADEESSK